MNDSILDSIKEMLGVSSDVFDAGFDNTIIIHINSLISVLSMIGIGDNENFEVQDSNQTWTEYIENPTIRSMAKDYIFLHTKLEFDPPTSSAVIDAMERKIQMLAFYLGISADKT